MECSAYPSYSPLAIDCNELSVPLAGWTHQDRVQNTSTAVRSSTSSKAPKKYEPMHSDLLKCHSFDGQSDRFHNLRKPGQASRGITPFPQTLSSSAFNAQEEVKIHQHMEQTFSMSDSTFVCGEIFVAESNFEWKGCGKRFSRIYDLAGHFLSPPGQQCILPLWTINTAGGTSVLNKIDNYRTGSLSLPPVLYTLYPELAIVFSHQAGLDIPAGQVFSRDTSIRLDSMLSSDFTYSDDSSPFQYETCECQGRNATNGTGDCQCIQASLYYNYQQYERQPRLLRKKSILSTTTHDSGIDMGCRSVSPLSDNMFDQNEHQICNPNLQYSADRSVILNHVDVSLIPNAQMDNFETGTLSLSESKYSKTSDDMEFRKWLETDPDARALSSQMSTATRFEEDVVEIHKDVISQISREIADDVLKRYWATHSSGAYRECPACPNSGHPSPQGSHSQSTSTNQTPASRPSNWDGDDSNESDKKKPQRRRNHRHTRSKSNGNDTRLLACPYNKCDPIRFSAQNLDEYVYRNCGTCIIRDIPRLKQHLYRHHERPKYCCISCGAEFTNQAECDAHTLKRPACVPCNPPPFIEKMSPDQAERIRGRDVGRWEDIFKILFPDIPVPSSPYQNDRTSELRNSFTSFFRIFEPDSFRHIMNNRRQRGEPLNPTDAMIEEIAHEAFQIASAEFENQIQSSGLQPVGMVTHEAPRHRNMERTEHHFVTEAGYSWGPSPVQHVDPTTMAGQQGFDQLDPTELRSFERFYPNPY